MKNEEFKLLFLQYEQDITTTDPGGETELMACAEVCSYSAAVYVLQNSDTHQKGTAPRARLDMIYCLPSGVKNEKCVHILKTSGCYTNTDISPFFVPILIPTFGECVLNICVLAHL